MRRLKGTGVVPGVAAGPAVLLVRRGRALRVPVAAGNVCDEIARLERARSRSRRYGSSMPSNSVATSSNARWTAHSAFTRSS